MKAIDNRNQNYWSIKSDKFCFDFPVFVIAISLQHIFCYKLSVLQDIESAFFRDFSAGCNICLFWKISHFSVSYSFICESTTLEQQW